MSGKSVITVNVLRHDLVNTMNPKAQISGARAMILATRMRRVAVDQSMGMLP